MSPATLRRYRAERLLREEFEGLRARVTCAARGRLLLSGVCLDQSDLEACYAQAWQGLYAAVLDGHQIANPTGWLVLVTFRRAIEEHRSRCREANGGGRRAIDGAHGDLRETGAPEHDLADGLDDRIRLRQLFEGMRGRLSGRELQAATLCYLHGLTRAEAAERMGISQARMRKLMEGQGPGRPGVAGKVGVLVETIRDGRWCAEQASLMRGYAYGILDPAGDRYRLARAHRDECPACRAYVVSLRGLAAVLPPVFPPWPLAAALLAGAGAQGGGGVGGALAAPGAAGGGAGAASTGGGSVLSGGSLAAKLAAGCLLAAGVGAGCVAIRSAEVHHRRVAPPRPGAQAVRLGAAAIVPASTPALAQGSAPTTGGRKQVRASPRTRTQARLATAREFRPEQAAAFVTVLRAPVQPVRSVAPGAAQREFGPG